jgi:hypothetical protein
MVEGRATVVFNEAAGIAKSEERWTLPTFWLDCTWNANGWEQPSWPSSISRLEEQSDEDGHRPGW